MNCIEVVAMPPAMKRVVPTTPTLAARRVVGSRAEEAMVGGDWEGVDRL